MFMPLRIIVTGFVGCVMVGGDDCIFQPFQVVKNKIWSGNFDTPKVYHFYGCIHYHLSIDKELSYLL